MQAGKTSAIDIAFERDEWSVKAVSASDPLFWVRVETPRPGAKAITVSDATPGGQDEAVLAWALAQILSRWNLAGIERIVFADIEPAGTHASSSPAEIERITERITERLTAILDRVLAVTSLRRTSRTLRERRDKLDFVFGLDEIPGR